MQTARGASTAAPASSTAAPASSTTASAATRAGDDDDARPVVRWAVNVVSLRCLRSGYYKATDQQNACE
ncbi:MAG TPA: hypothetical protein DGT23_08890 [Micromonosporaceae bacterium]|nr:hypothetical protein [Micromonosporaceae bacterium]